MDTGDLWWVFRVLLGFLLYSATFSSAFHKNSNMGPKMGQVKARHQNMYFFFFFENDSQNLKENDRNFLVLGLGYLASSEAQTPEERESWGIGKFVERKNEKEKKRWTQQTSVYCIEWPEHRQILGLSVRNITFIWTNLSSPRSYISRCKKVTWAKSKRCRFIWSFLKLRDLTVVVAYELDIIFYLFTLLFDCCEWGCFGNFILLLFRIKEHQSVPHT